MQISERDWVYGRSQRLEKIYKIIEANIEVMDKYLESFKGKLIATNKMMWEDTVHFTDDFDRLVETKQHLTY